MINIAAETKLSSEEIKQKLKDYFGAGGLKLEISEEVEDCLTFVGGGGYVSAKITNRDEKNKIDIIAKEWEYQAKEFITIL